MPIDLPNARIQNDTVHAENVVFSVSVSVPSEEVSDHWTAETMHTHPYPELFICQSSGIGILTSQGSYVLNPMQMLMIPPGISHVKLAGGTHWLSIGYSYTKGNTDGTHNYYRLLERLSGGTSMRILSDDPGLCGRVYEYMRNGQQKTAGLKALFMLETLLHIQANSHTEPANCLPLKSVGYGFERLIQLELILADYTGDTSLSEAASKLSISERQLSRFVYANYGASYHALILQRRLEMAYKLLTQTSLTAEIIGQKVGFHNKTAFYSAFRKRYGTSPIKLRNNMADGTDDPVIDVPK